MYLEYHKILKERSIYLNKVRTFFFDNAYIEIDPPHITKKPSIDEHINLMTTYVNNQELGYLHSSPEYMMKRLLSLGLDKIYFLGHVFRKDEIGEIHNPEFTMIEWYRKECSFQSFLDETVELIYLFLNRKELKKISYRNLFIEYANIDYTKTSIEDLNQTLQENEISISENIQDKDSLLNLILTHLIEPKMQKDLLYIVYDYPKSQAALAKTYLQDDIEVAMRFEIYFNGIELANGFHELSCSKIQKNRFVEINKKRKEPLPIDENFLLALQKGIGDCYGIAVGFDRLFMLAKNKSSIKDIQSFSWDSI